jgi:ABC-type uncharacterized transport system permease subunit
MGVVSVQETVWPALLGAASMWALLSAVIVVLTVRLGMNRLALGWMVSFVVSSLVAAYSFWRLP